MNTKAIKRRSFSCSDELWNKISEYCKDCYPVSKFIRKAVEEKIALIEMPEQMVSHNFQQNRKV